MTKQRSFKRLVRVRMAKTGEGYTAARAVLLAGAPAGPDEQSAPLATTDEAIRERTGRGWEEWFDPLDESVAPGTSHRDIARWVADLLGIAPLAWNAQAITGSYERARRGRAVGQHEDGFTVHASRTVAVPIERLYDAFADPAVRTRWLPDAPLRERTSTRSRSALRLGRRRVARRRGLRRQGRRAEHCLGGPFTAAGQVRGGRAEDVVARSARRGQDDARGRSDRCLTSILPRSPVRRSCRS